MPILNYTTKVPVNRTLAEIQKKLAAAGAKQILSEFDNDGDVSSVSFRMLYRDVMISFKLPAQVDPIYVILQDTKGITYKQRSREHAKRVAWRIVKDWIEAQLALVEAEQAEMVEVFLPYAQNPATGETVFKTLVNSNFKLLGGPS